MNEELPPTPNPVAPPPPPPLPPALPDARPQLVSRPEFHGSGSEFFRIWIVNFLLTLVTLGFYIPWAKVRTRRYFYRQTRIGEENFDYLADPRKLLIGYMIVGIFLLLYTFGEYLSVYVVPAVAIVFFIVLPWIRWKSARFFAANSSYRNLTFSFTGTLGGAYKVFLGYPALAVITLGILYPLAAFKSREYYFANFRYGNIASEFRGRPGFFFAAYFATFGVFMALIIALMIAFSVTTAFSMFSSLSNAEASEVYYEATEEPIDVDGDESASVTYEPFEGTDGSASLDPNNYLGIEGTEESDFYESDFDEFDFDAFGGVMAGFFFIFFLSYALFFAGLAFLHVLVLNHCWSNVRFNTIGGPVAFVSKIHPVRFIWINFSNLVLCVITLGIYIPFAKVRLHRYRLDCLEVQDVQLAETVEGTGRVQVGVLGETASDWLDFDFGL